MKKVDLKIVKGIKFSFVIPKKAAGTVVALAIENDLEVTYKGFQHFETHTLIKGFGKVENVTKLISETELTMSDYPDLLDFLESFKYKETDLAIPIPIPFADKVKEPIVTPKKK